MCLFCQSKIHKCHRCQRGPSTREACPPAGEAPITVTAQQRPAEGQPTVPGNVAQGGRNRSPEKDSPFPTSQQLSQDGGRPGGFPYALGNLTDTSSSQVHTPRAPAMRKGWAGPSIRFQVFSSVSTTTTVPYPVDNSMEPSCIPLVPNLRHTLHQLQGGLCPPHWLTIHQPGRSLEP